jgi:hypothetical protein
MDGLVDGDWEGTALSPMSASMTSADVRRVNRNSGCTVEPAGPVGPRATRITGHAAGIDRAQVGETEWRRDVGETLAIGRRCP